MTHVGRTAATDEHRHSTLPRSRGIAESQAIRGANLTKDRYQLGANIAGTLACSWIRVWSQARRAGDTQTAEQAVAAMATAKHLELVVGLLDARELGGLAAGEVLGVLPQREPRAYLLKEQLRHIYRLPAEQAIELLDAWMGWARRCRLAPFVKLARTIAAQRRGIVAAIEHGLSNARVEAINTQIRMVTRRAYGFHSPAAVIALAMLCLSGLCPPLPR